MVKISNEVKRKLLVKAIKSNNLDCHIVHHEYKKDAHTYASKIMNNFLKKDGIVYKSSYLYCDTLDANFFYMEDGTATCSFSGYIHVESDDFKKEKLLDAFKIVNKVLGNMNELMFEYKNSVTDKGD